MAYIKKGNDKDEITGTNGMDFIYALGGDDTIYALGGDDYIKAGYGNDRVIGGAGSDLMYGEQGSDTFVFDVGHGGDKIADFSESDQIVLQGEIDGYYAFKSDGGDVRLVTLDQTSDGWVKTGSITLLGISPEEWKVMTGEEVDNYAANPGTWTARTTDVQLVQATQPAPTLIDFV